MDEKISFKITTVEYKPRFGDRIALFVKKYIFKIPFAESVICKIFYWLHIPYPMVWWRVEVSDEIVFLHGEGVEEEMTRLIAEEIKREISREDLDKVV